MNRAKKSPTVVATPQFEVPAAWLLDVANITDDDLVLEFGYEGIDAQAIAHTFLFPGKYVVTQLMDEGRDSTITSITHKMSATNKSKYTHAVVNSGGLNDFIELADPIDVYTTSMTSVAIEFLIVYTLAHPNVRDTLNTICNKMLHHFDANASGTFKDLQTRRAKLTETYKSEAYISEVYAAARLELDRRTDVLLQSLCSLLIPVALEHLVETSSSIPGQHVTCAAAKYALDVACARLQERRDESGFWYSESPRDEASGWRFPLTEHMRSTREDFESPAYMAVGWFDTAFKAALSMFALGSART